MYSGAEVDLAVGVVGVSDPDPSEDGNSKADLNEISEVPVAGSLLERVENRFEASAALRQALITLSFKALSGVSKGFWTSLATLTTTSNFDASSAVGSRYSQTPVSYILIGPFG